MLDTSARQGILKPIRLVIVDPQPIVLQGLRSVLGTQPDFDVVASSSDRTSCLEAIRKLTPDVALLADKVPDLTVSEILAIVKAEKLSTRLVFFTESDTDHDLTSAIAAGACSAISKYASPATMLRSLRLMTKSGVALEKSDLSAPGKEADGDSKVEGMLELLTQRERQIARLVAEGMSNKEIARQLNVSDGTVKVHLYNIFQKLEITNRTVLATIALLQRPSGLAALSLAFLALAIADELKASEANDIFPDENGVGRVDEHAGYEPWKKGILRHLVVWESGEPPTQAQRDLFAKAAQITNPAAAMEALRAAEQSGGAKAWTHHAPAGSGAPDLPVPLLRGANDIQVGVDPAPEHQFPRLLSNAMSMHGGYGNFAILTGALIYALEDPHLAAHAHDLRQASIDSILAVTAESATTKLAAITHAAANHDDNSAPGFLSHDVRLSFAAVTTGNGNLAEGALGEKGPGDAGDNLHKFVGADPGHDAGVGGGGDVEKIVYRSPIDSESNQFKSTSSDAVFDFASGPGRINLAAFGALAWLHMTAATKSIPPHTVAWVYDSASNETIVYVNATDHILDIGDRGLLEIHLEGIVAVAEADVGSEPDGAAVATTLEQLEAALIPAIATDEAALTKDHVQTSIEGSESSLGTAGAWALLANNGSGFHFGQTRTGLGAPTRLRSSSDASADATEESDAASAASAHASSIELAHSATAPAAANVASNNGPINAGNGVSSTGPNEIGQPSVVTADSAGHGNSQHASEPSTEAGSKPGNGVGHDAEHHDKASDAPGGSAKNAEPDGAEHGKAGHSNAAKAPDAAETDPDVATAADAGHGNSKHASEPGSAKAAADESTEAGSKAGHGVGNGAEHHASASEAPGGPAKKADPGGAEHGKSGHSAAPNAPDAGEIDPGAAIAAGAGHGNPQHASEPGSAKAAATESTEAGSKPGHGVGNDAEHHASASDAAHGPAKTAEPGGAEHGKSGHSAAPNAPAAAEIDQGAATVAGAGHDNPQHASEPGSAKAASTGSTEDGGKPGNGAGDGAEHHASASEAPGGSAQKAEPDGAEHGKSGHSAAASPPDGAAIDPAAATPASAGHGNSQRASEPGSAKAASTESTEHGGKPGNGAGDGAEHPSSASQAAGTVKTAEPATVDHGNSQHAAQSAAIADDAHTAKAAFETGGADQGPVFRFDSGVAPSAFVEIVGLKEFNHPLDAHVPPGQEEGLGFNVKLVPHALNGHADDHGTNSPHQAILPAHHDLLI
ncbi:LuxR C-terminal-related transcriptional regulator [Bradyrhizobium sp. 30]|uniref:LuxR C-terminal-related transcriptional regulator n=1 Tax=Bradyrhizobium sp. 30 TaxID=2782669 RepID=UPI001FF84EE1|nr:LuxR C-terminal-related transcriptional regulator [Bradyrhizobium sp. 30]MCK1294656.1 response regulator [Bradyrhizobium sp. 30]